MPRKPRISQREKRYAREKSKKESIKKWLSQLCDSRFLNKGVRSYRARICVISPTYIVWKSPFL